MCISISSEHYLGSFLLSQCQLCYLFSAHSYDKSHLFATFVSYLLTTLNSLCLHLNYIHLTFNCALVILPPFSILACVQVGLFTFGPITIKIETCLSSNFFKMFKYISNTQYVLSPLLFVIGYTFPVYVTMFLVCAVCALIRCLRCGGTFFK